MTTIKPTMGEIIRLNAEARGNIVDNINDADIVLAPERTKVKEGSVLVNQYDLDILMSKYL